MAESPGEGWRKGRAALDYLERHPANVAALAADLAKLDPIWDHLVPAE